MHTTVSLTESENASHHDTQDIWTGLWPQIQSWAKELGFSQIGLTGVDLSEAEAGLTAWLAAGFHGDMHYMQKHGTQRARPAQLVPGTLSVISVCMNYLSASTPEDWRQREWARLQQPEQAQISVYARGRDYHKVLRQRLQKLAEHITTALQAMPHATQHRVFVDSAPVLEVELNTRAQLTWRGKHTLALHPQQGSMFFLGEICLNLPLPPKGLPAQALQPVPSGEEEVPNHCGSCQACIDICPTQAIVAPYRLDARRCISYLTIEHPGPIPLEFRPLIGNRIYGCDDCQLVCPWNKFAKRSPLPDFDERHGLGSATLLELLSWSEAQFLQRTEGSAIRRIGYERWQRNLAVAAGNALHGVKKGKDLPEETQSALRTALQQWQGHASALVQEHIDWALAVEVS